MCLHVPLIALPARSDVNRRSNLAIWAFNNFQERLRSPRLRRAINHAATLTLPSAKSVMPGSGLAGRITAEVEHRSWADLGNLFDPARLTALREELQSRKCYDPWHPEFGEFDLRNPPATTHNARIVGVVDIPDAVNIANHPVVLEVAARYLGCMPTIDDLVAWWSIPGRAAPQEEQFFHRDNDAIRFIKLFIYLSDVVADEGAHELIQGSHNRSRLLHRRRRYADGEVYSAFDRSDRIVIEGKFGSAFMEDTFSLHKGAVPRTRHRLLFQARYSSIPSTFAGNPKWRISGTGLDAYTNRYL